jgi:L-lactate dehydrogenase complex protein LldG
VLLDPRDIVPGLHDIYRHPGMAHPRYHVLLTGPSATADIEGVLIHGAQGVRSLTVVMRARDGASRPLLAGDAVPTL